MFYLVLIDWSGPNLFGEQMLAMRDIASSYLTKDYPARVEFTHSLLEGFLTHKGSAIFGSFSGPRFHADFGTHRDAPWNCEFILPTHSVRALIDEDTVLFRGEFENGKLVGEPQRVNIAESRASTRNIL